MPRAELKRVKKNPLPMFGAKLRAARNRMCPKVSMLKMTEMLRIRVTQSLIRDYEAGVVLDPNMAILKDISRITGWGYREMVIALAEEKYGVSLNANGLKTTIVDIGPVVLEINVREKK